MFVDTYLELQEIKESVGAESMKTNTWRTKLKEVYRLKFRLFSIMVLFVLGSTPGLFAFYYTTTVFCLVGVPPFTTAVIFGVLLFTAGFVPMLLTDKVGRKPILIFFSTLNFAAGTTAAVLIQLFGSPLNDLVAYAVVFLICVYAFGFSSSWLVMPWLLGSEVFPTDVRGMMSSISAVSYALFGFVMNQLTPVIIGSPLQLHGFLYLVSGESLVVALFVFVALPETKDVSLEEMDKLFSQSFWKNMKQSIRCKLSTGNKSPEVQLDLSCQDVKDLETYTEQNYQL